VGLFFGLGAGVPLFVVLLAGARNTAGIDIFMHSLGVPLMAGLLAIADILLIELALVGMLKPIKFLLPSKLSKLFKVYDIIKTMQKYHYLPKPERVVSVFVACITGGIISALLLFLAGAF
jgi:hypothetical protein